MDLSKIVVAPKISRWEYDQRKFNLTPDEVVNKWKEEGESEEEIKRSLDSHYRQHKAINLIRKALPESRFLTRDELSREAVRNAPLVISAGGDDHFQYVSHYLDNTPILGVNTDPATSDGALLTFSAESLERLIPYLREDKVVYEEWPRLEGELRSGNNLVKLERAMSQFSIKSEDPDGMYRHILELKDESSNIDSWRNHHTER